MKNRNIGMRGGIFVSVYFIGMGALALVFGVPEVVLANDAVRICHVHDGGFVSEDITKDRLAPVMESWFGSDIIPPFDYEVGSSTENFAGQNWNADNQEIYNNDCVEVVAQEDPSSHGTSTASSTQESNDSNNSPVEYDEPEYSYADLIAYKVVCDAEVYLPNWGDYGVGGGSDNTIDLGDVKDFVNANKEHCELVSDWYFEWSYQTYPTPDDNTIGPVGSPWTVFGPTNAAGMAQTTIDITHNEKVEVREVMQSGYVPFAGDTTSNSVSAEFYCHTDLSKYDNHEFVNDMEHNENYYCVAFNALPSENNGGGGDDSDDSDDSNDDNSNDDPSDSVGKGGGGACLNCDSGDDDDIEVKGSGGGGSLLNDDGGSDSDEPEEITVASQSVVLPVGAPNAGFGGTQGANEVAAFMLLLLSCLSALVGFHLRFAK